MNGSRLNRALTQMCALCLTAHLAIGSAQAQAVLPADVARTIEQAAQDIRQQAARDRQIADRQRALGMAPADAPADSRYAGEVMGAAVVSAIGRYPQLTGEIVSAAGAAVPEAHNHIVSRATAAYPAFASRIQGSGGTSQQPRPYQSSAPFPGDLGADSLNLTPAAAPAPTPRPYQSAATFPGTLPPGWIDVSGSADVTPVPATGTVAAPSNDVAAMDEVPEMEAIGGSTGQIDDPWEGFNRGVFAVNEVVDRFLLKPVAQAYGWVMPEIVKTSVRNGFDNLMTPVVLANDLLQLEFRDAAVTTSRFIANSTMGIGGLFDVATGMGLPAHPSDFGQTLHSYGSESGPYVVLPLLGPSSVRDGIGLGVDTFLHPFTYVMNSTVNLSLAGGRAVTTREQLLEPLDELKASSVDYYAALRSAYVQDRAVELRRGRAPDTSDVDDMFDSFQ